VPCSTSVYSPASVSPIPALRTAARFLPWMYVHIQAEYLRVCHMSLLLPNLYAVPYIITATLTCSARPTRPSCLCLVFHNATASVTRYHIIKIALD